MRQLYQRCISAPAIFLSVALSTTLAAAQVAGFGVSTVDCPSGGGTRGYDNIASINNDIAAELSKIQAGAPSQEPYIFVLCPSTTFTVDDTPLLPQLSGSVFTCGTSGAVDNNCTFVGGADQVVVNRPTNAGYELKMLSFVGLTFSNFTTSAIKGDAGASTTISVFRSNFEDFQSMFVVQQATTDNREPFQLQVFESEIKGGSGGVAFSNVGGELSLENLLVTDSNFQSLASTGTTTVGEEGATFLRGVSVESSSIRDVFVAVAGADIDAMGVSVSSMESMENVFLIEGSGSSVTIQDSSLESNAPSTVPPVRWTGVDVQNGATASVSNTTISGNTNVRHIFSASNQSSLTLYGITVADTTGGRAIETLDVSAVVFANILSTATVSAFNVSAIQDFTALLFANGNSRLDVQQLCADSGNTQAVVYVSEESQYSSLDNYIGPNFISSVCPDPGLRLVQESPNSGCFQANRTDCSFNCTTFFDAETCRAQVTEAPTSRPTQKPSAKPSLPPTLAPTINMTSATPVTAAPSNITMAPSEAPSFVTTIPTSAPTTKKPASSQPETTSPAPSRYYTNSPTVKPTKPICDCSKSAKGKGKGKGSKGGGSKKSKGSKGSKGSTYMDDDFFNDYYDDFYDDSYCDCGSYGNGKGKGGKSSYQGTRGADWRSYHSAQVNHQFQKLDLNNLYNR